MVAHHPRLGDGAAFLCTSAPLVFGFLGSGCLAAGAAACARPVAQVAAARSPELLEEAGADPMAIDGPPALARQSSTAGLLTAEVPKVIKAAARQLKEKSSKTRIAAFYCLRQLVVTLPGCLSAHAATIVPGLHKALKDPHSNPMRIE